MTESDEPRAHYSIEQTQHEKILVEEVTSKHESDREEEEEEHTY
jgi:hypothetical protein